MSHFVLQEGRDLVMCIATTIKNTQLQCTSAHLVPSDGDIVGRPLVLVEDL